jgi:hypothetical protein
MYKKKFLLVEFTAHHRNALDNFKLFNKFFDCYFLIDKKNKNKIKLNKKKIIFKLPKIFILLYIIFNGYKYRYIYFSTPHEYPDYPKGLINNINFFYNFFLYTIILLIYNKKVILQLRGLHRYFPNINSRLNKPILYSNLRNIYLRQCKIIVCESNYLKKKLINYLGKQNCSNKKIFTIYYAYPQKKLKISFKFNKKKLNIGILGMVDEKRKNYQQLHNLLKNKYFLKKEVTLTFLGAANGAFAISKVKGFSKLCKRIISKEYFNDKEFLRFGNKCDFLISLNNKTNFYGKYRMSGCFGDAILLKKKLYCPDFEDPDRELSGFTFYFKKIEKIIRDIESSKKKTIIFDLLNYKYNINFIKNNLILE